jgi:hypothetical protein
MTNSYRNGLWFVHVPLSPRRRSVLEIFATYVEIWSSRGTWELNEQGRHACLCNTLDIRLCAAWAFSLLAFEVPIVSLEIKKEIKNKTDWAVLSLAKCLDRGRMWSSGNRKPMEPTTLTVAGTAIMGNVHIYPIVEFMEALPGYMRDEALPHTSYTNQFPVLTTSTTLSHLYSSSARASY